MVNNNSIYKKIEEKGNKEAQAIIDAGRAKAAAIEKSVLAGYENEANEIVESAKRAGENYVGTTLTQVEQTAKQRALAEKKAQIAKVVEGAHERLLKLDDQRLSALVIKILKAEAIQGDETVCVSRDDYSKYQRLFTSGKGNELTVLNRELGDKYHLTLSREPAEIKGGFVIKGKRYDIDHSFKVLLEDVKETYEAEIAQMLFGEEA